MNQQNEKPPGQAEPVPATGAELTWIAVFLALCLMANSWMMAKTQEFESHKTAPSAAPVVQQTSPVSTPERPSRDRSSSRDRQWRDPNSPNLAGF
jgi:hypothetical protein